MNNKTLIVMLLLAAISTAQNTITQTEFLNGTTGLNGQGPSIILELANSWQTLAALAIMISAILTAIGYAIGVGFEMPELKAWAGSELVQVFTNAIIILALIAIIAFLDVIVVGIVTDSGLPVKCTPGSSCLQTVTTLYLNDYIAAANTTAKDVLTNNINAAAAANRRVGITCLTIYCAQFGFSTTIAAQKVLDQDYYAIIFEYVTNLLSFMQAQAFFVTEICFKMAPVVLAIGVVARSFFFSRKIGGLLMAVAIGAIFFFPGMYIFDWLTLDVALNGDKSMDNEQSVCPAECAISPALAYYTKGTTDHLMNSTQDVDNAFGDTDPEIAKATDLLQRNVASEVGTVGDASGQTVYSCYFGDYDGQDVYSDGGKVKKSDNYVVYSDCPAACRELPYPGTTPICAALKTQLACGELPIQCKVIRKVQTINLTQYAQCPASCRVIPPLKSDCRGPLDTGPASQWYTTSSGSPVAATDRYLCANSRFDCRVADRTDLIAATPILTRRPTPAPGTPDSPPDYQNSRCLEASNCVASMNASLSCVYVMPETGSCDDLCTDCPVYCRLNGALNLSNLPADCKTTAGTALRPECTACIANHDSCTMNITALNALRATALAASNCSSCQAEDMIIYPGLPALYSSGGCDPATCSPNYKATMPTSACQNCLFAEASYTYDPPVNTQCADLCAPTDNAPVGKAGDYMNVGAEGMVGKPEIQDVAKLMLPIYVLPLFNIVATLVFIKALSGFLGGDIEIPGLSKVF